MVLNLLMFVAFVAGMGVGGRLATVREGEVSIPASGFFRGSTKKIRVLAGSFAGAALCLLLRLVSVYFDSTGLAWMAVAAMVLTIGAAWGAMIFGDRAEKTQS